MSGPDRNPNREAIMKAMVRTMIYASILAVVFMPTSILNAGQSQPPAGLRDLTWGMRADKIMELYPGRGCKATPKDEFGDWVCIATVEINGIWPEVFLWGWSGEPGGHDGLHAFELSFKSESLQSILDAFEARYGKPNKVEKTELQTQGGGKFPNLHFLWTFTNGSEISIWQHAGKLGEATASVKTKISVTESKRRSDARKRKAGEGL